jgi:hypothetical protein
MGESLLKSKSGLLSALLKPQAPLLIWTVSACCALGVIIAYHALPIQPEAILIPLLFALAMTTLKKVEPEDRVALACWWGLFSGYTSLQLHEIAAKEEGAAIFSDTPITLSGTVGPTTKNSRLSRIFSLWDLAIKPQKEGEEYRPIFFSNAICALQPPKKIPYRSRVSIVCPGLKPPSANLALKCKQERLIGYLFTSPGMITIKQKEKIRMAAHEQLAYALKSSTAYQLFWSIVWGNGEATSTAIRQWFLNWGISHYLARSGMHIVLLASIINLIAGKALPPYLVAAITLGTIILYSHASQGSLPFWRAWWLQILSILAFAFGLRRNPLHTLGLITTWNLLANPYMLFSLSFQLSFSISFIILVLQKSSGHSSKNR